MFDAEEEAGRAILVGQRRPALSADRGRRNSLSRTPEDRHKGDDAQVRACRRDVPRKLVADGIGRDIVDP